MLKLEALDLQWLREVEDHSDDQCAHGRMLLEIDGATLVRPEDGLLTLSAAGLFLLRTLTDDHTVSSRIAEANLLLPCCGFFLVAGTGRFPVVIHGCPNGVDLEVTHAGGRVTVRSAEVLKSVPEAAWRSAVVSFAATIRDFYAASAPKNAAFDQSDREGWAAFWREWDERWAAAKAGR